MPVYEYKCEKCNHVQEKFHKMADNNEEKCEKCEAKAEHLKKQLTPHPKHISWQNW